MRTTFRRLAGAVGGALLASALLPAAAHAEPAALTGTIAAADTGAPLQGCVSVYDTEWNWAGGACSDESGQWMIGDLEAGRAYKVEVTTWEGAYVGEWAQDARSFEEAESFVAPAEVPVSLELGAQLTGTLTRADGSPADWTASVAVTSPDGMDTVAWPSIDADGSWRATVPAGDYVVEFSTWPARQWAFGAATLEEASVFSVKAGDVVTVDDRLLAMATVAGTLVSDTDGSPVAGACVGIVPAPLTGEDDWPVGEACTDESGSYTVEVPGAGTYTAQMTDPEARFAPEYHGDTVVASEAATFEVSRGETTTVDASLAPAATITGLAVDGKLGTPIEGACPSAYLGNAGGYARGQVTECSGPDGRWTVRGLAVGDYALHLGTGWQTAYMAGTWAFKADSQATADLVNVGVGEVKTVRNVKLAPGGTLTGRVTDQFGNPVADAYVDLDGGFPGRAGPGEGQYVAHTDEDGRYTVLGVPAGDYRPIVYSGDYASFAPEWSGDSDTLSGATAVSVKAGKATSLDFEVGPAARISGVVVERDGAATQAYWVGFVHTSDGDYIGDFDVWDGNSFSTGALPGGDFVLRLENPETGEVVWYDSATSADDATVVSLGRGEQREITIRLP